MFPPPQMPTTIPSLPSRIRATFYGVLTCDALGGPPQFKPRGTYPRITTFQPIEHFHQPPGAWSDDGSLTLCLAQSLAHASAAAPEPTWRKDDCVGKFCAWLAEGYMSSAEEAWDVGRGTRVALEEWQREVDAPRMGEVWKLDVERGQTRVDKVVKFEKNSGNGSLMRCAPVGLVFRLDERRARRVAREQSDVTHPSPVCGDACSLYTVLIIRVLEGEGKEDLAAAVAEEDISDRGLRERLRRYKTLGDWEDAEVDDIRSSGWVVDTLEAALWSFFSTKSFRGGAVKAVNLGMDTDTVGAVYGGLAGAFYGFDAVPEEWREGIAKKDMVDGVISGVLNVACKGGVS